MNPVLPASPPLLPAIGAPRGPQARHVSLAPPENLSEGTMRLASTWPRSPVNSVMPAGLLKIVERKSADEALPAKAVPSASALFSRMAKPEAWASRAPSTQTRAAPRIAATPDKRIIGTSPKETRGLRRLAWRASRMARAAAPSFEGNLLGAAGQWQWDPA